MVQKTALVIAAYTGPSLMPVQYKRIARAEGNAQLISCIPSVRSL